MTDMEHGNNPSAPRKGQRICPRCGSPFVCGVAAGTGECWCFELPHVLTVPETDGAAACLCPNCLNQRIREIQSARLNASQEPDED